MQDMVPARTDGARRTASDWPNAFTTGPSKT